MPTRKLLFHEANIMIRVLLCGLLALAADSTVRAQAVPETIGAEGVPEVPRTLVRALNRYQNTRSASFGGWFGSGREILIRTRFADTPQVHRVAFPGGARTQLTFLDERVLGESPRPGREEFAFAADEGGAENYQIFVNELASGSVNRVTDGRSRNLLAGWSPTGAHLAWSSNARNGKDMDLYVMDGSGPKSIRRLKEVTGSWSIEDWSPDDARVAAIEYVSANESYVHVIDVVSGRTEAITPRASSGGPTVSYGSVKWSKDGKSLYWTTDLDSEFSGLARYDLATRTSTRLTAEIPWDVESYDLSDDGRTIVLVTNEDGASKIHVLDTATGRERPAPRLPAGVISGVTFRRGSQEFAFAMSSARAAGDVYSFDLATGQFARWTTSETGGLNPQTFAEAELIHYPSFDGRRIPAFVYRPGARFQGKRPVLIDIHGGPEGQYRPAFLARLNYLIDELGITLIFPNVRGSAGYGKSYLKLDNGMRREDSVKDIGALLDWVAQQPGLDASRVGVIGGSYGGYMTLASLTHYSDRFKAGIDIVGISNFVTFLKNTQDYRRDLRRAEYGDEREPEMKSFLEKISPLSSASKIKVPLLIVQGKNDPRVPVTESEQILSAVRKNGGPVWYILGKNEGHGFAKKSNQDYLQAAEILFLKQFLLGGTKGAAQ